MLMSIAFLFPGQGSPTPGMFDGLPAHPVTDATLNEASSILGRDVRRFVEEAALVSEESVQIALLVVGVAAARVLLAEGVKPDLVGGMSVGAFAAAVAASALNFGEALSLVQLRARLMIEAYPTGYGLSVITGLDERRVSRLVESVRTPEFPVYLANFNAPSQLVIAGSDAAMAEVLRRAATEGARKAQRLAVNVPSHCPLYERVSAEMRKAMVAVPMRRPLIPCLGNCHGRALFDTEPLREDLAASLCHPVRWHEATTVAFERGVRLFIETPPDSTLTDLAEAAFPEARAVAMAHQPLETIVRLAKGQELPPS
jgi:malonate decarboxylase epsilon subunit